jgi:hypothetical protein
VKGHTKNNQLRLAPSSWIAVITRIGSLLAGRSSRHRRSRGEEFPSSPDLQIIFIGCEDSSDRRIMGAKMGAKGSPIRRQVKRQR